MPSRLADTHQRGPVKKLSGKVSHVRRRDDRLDGALHEVYQGHRAPLVELAHDIIEQEQGPCSHDLKGELDLGHLERKRN